MKILFKSLCAGIIFAILFTLVPFEAQCREISDQVFRVHILANSDSDADQSLKLKVRDAVIEKAEVLLLDAHSKEDAKVIVEDNLDVFTSAAQQVIESEGYDYPVSARVTTAAFDTRYYGDITMPAGEYDCLQMTIGKAEGKNWWCVMYPSLCIFSDSKTETLEDKLTTNQYGIVSSKGKYRYRFRIVEALNSLFSIFS